MNARTTPFITRSWALVLALAISFAGALVFAAPSQAVTPMVAAGSDHTCALSSSGGVTCWGSNTFGQLGDGTNDDSSTPIGVSGLSTGVVFISAGLGFTCAVTTSGAVKCWGDNNLGQLGNGSTGDSTTPVDVSGLSSGVASISAGWYHTCAVTTSGAAKCWGDNGSGVLGNGTGIGSLVPVDVSGLSAGVASISAGFFHTCAVTTSGAAKCWGDNEYGTLGNTDVEYSNTPVDVSGMSSGVNSIAAGYYHTCATTTSGAAKCWGFNSFGQLGSDVSPGSNSPVDVTGLSSGAVSVSAGRFFSCALTTGGVKCWGSGGSLGNGASAGSNTPVDVAGLTSGIQSI